MNLKRHVDEIIKKKKDGAISNTTQIIHYIQNSYNKVEDVFKEEILKMDDDKFYDVFPRNHFDSNLNVVFVIGNTRMTSDFLTEIRVLESNLFKQCNTWLNEYDSISEKTYESLSANAEKNIYKFITKNGKEVLLDLNNDNPFMSIELIDEDNNAYKFLVKFENAEQELAAIKSPKNKNVVKAFIMYAE